MGSLKCGCCTGLLVENVVQIEIGEEKQRTGLMGEAHPYKAYEQLDTC